MKIKVEILMTDDAGLEKKEAVPPHVWLTDEAGEAKRLAEEGECVVFLLTEKNRQDRLEKVSRCVELPEAELENWQDWISQDYLEKAWQRHAGLPWRILKTQRIYLREMTLDDADALLEMYGDEELIKYMEPLETDRALLREWMEAYIKHMYGFYEFGIWMIVLQEDAADGSQKAAADDSQKAAADGSRKAAEDGGQKDAADGGQKIADVPDASMEGVQEKQAVSRRETIIGRDGLQMRDKDEFQELGFCIAKPWRESGYALEACRAVLQYGFEELELPAIRVVVHKENEKSLGLCEKLGFCVEKGRVSPNGLWITMTLQRME